MWAKFASLFLYTYGTIFQIAERNARTVSNWHIWGQ